MTEQPIKVYLPAPRPPVHGTAKHWGYLITGIILGLVAGYVLFENPTVLAPISDPRPVSLNFKKAVVEKAPTAKTITVTDQMPGDEATISQITLTTPGWVTIHDSLSGLPGRVLGAYYLPAGEYKNQKVPLLRGMIDGEKYLVVVHNDDGDQTFNLRLDLPRTGADGKVEMAPFSVSVPSRIGD
ncbi:MAG: hypothetical protein NTY66_04750 [Candidatus Vogelbacteria bacterium]|nr:hypothetical protein [Candidatus Vogelbacteria bacterium]